MIAMATMKMMAAMTQARVRTATEVAAPPAPPESPTPPEPPDPPRRSLARELAGLLLKIAVVAALVAILFSFVYGLCRVTGADMDPALKDGDLVAFYRLDRDYAAGDLVVLDWDGSTQVRRAVAVAGDTVDITDTGLVINGAPQQEINIFEKTERYEGGSALPITLGDGEVFVLGDGREGATDSRVYGAVASRDTLGSAIALIRRRGL